MNIRYFGMAAACLVGLSINTQVAAADLSAIIFDDSNLAACVAQAAGERNWVDTAQVTDLDCRMREINSLVGIEQLNQLVTLQLQNDSRNYTNRDNGISDLTPLNLIATLDNLNVRGNPLSQVNLQAFADTFTGSLFESDLGMPAISSFSVSSEIVDLDVDSYFNVDVTVDDPGAWPNGCLAELNSANGYGLTSLCGGWVQDLGTTVFDANTWLNPDIALGQWGIQLNIVTDNGSFNVRPKMLQALGFNPYIDIAGTSGLNDQNPPQVGSFSVVSAAVDVDSGPKAVEFNLAVTDLESGLSLAELHLSHPDGSFKNVSFNNGSNIGKVVFSDVDSAGEWNIGALVLRDYAENEQFINSDGFDPAWPTVIAVTNTTPSAGVLLSDLTFADPDLQACIDEAWATYVHQLTDLYCAWDERNVRSLAGIEQLFYLSYLNVESNGITDLSPVLQLPVLNELWAQNNAVPQANIDLFLSQFTGNAYTDDGRPEITAFSLTPSAVNVDAGDQIIDVNTSIDGMTDQWVTARWLSSVSSAEGEVAGLVSEALQLSVPHAVAWADLNLRLEFHDNNGSWWSIGHQALSAMGFDGVVTVSGSTAPNDAVDPTFISINILETQVDVSGSGYAVNIDVSASDDNSGVDVVEVHFVDPEGGWYAHTAHVSGASGTIFFDNAYKPGVWAIGLVTVRDMAGNYRHVDEWEFDPSWNTSFELINTNYVDYSEDADGDGWVDSQDAFPNDAREWQDDDGDGIGNNSDLDSDNDGYVDSYEMAQGTDAYNSGSMPATSVYQPHLKSGFGDDGIADFELSFAGQFPGITADYYQLEWINRLADGYLISGMLSDDRAADLDISHHFLAKLDANGTLDLSFGDNGFVLREYYWSRDIYQDRNDVVELADGSLVWYWRGVVQKLGASGMLDASFNDQTWSNPAARTLDPGTTGVFLPYDSTHANIWGNLQLAASGNIKVLGCRLDDASRTDIGNCDLSWFEISPSGQALSVTDLGVDLTQTGVDPISGRTVREAFTKVSVLANGEMVMSVEASEGGNGYTGYATRVGLYKLDSNGVLDAAADQPVYNDDVAADRNGWSYFDDVILADDGFIYALRGVGDYAGDWSEGVQFTEMMRFDALLNLDTSYHGFGSTQFREQGVWAAAQFVSRTQPVVQVVRGVNGQSLPYIRHYSVDGDLMTETQAVQFAPDFNLGTPYENRGYRQNSGNVLLGAAASDATDSANPSGSARFQIALVTVAFIDSDGDGVANDEDAFPFDPLETLDTDGDGIGNNADDNDDGDAELDINDAFPLDASETTDTDGDGRGDNSDLDIDGDGVTNDYELAKGTDPYSSASKPTLNFFAPQRDQNLAASGFNEVTLPSFVGGESFDAVEVTYINEIDTGFLVSGHLNAYAEVNVWDHETNTDTIEIQLQISHYFVARLNDQAALDTSFGEGGMVVQPKATAWASRPTAYGLNDGSVIWVWADGVIQKLDVFGNIDHSFTNADGVFEVDYGVPVGTPAIYTPRFSSAIWWGSVHVDAASDTFKVLGCTVPSWGDCDLQWYMFNSDGSIDTRLSATGMVDIGLDLAAAADPVSGRMVSPFGFELTPLASGEMLLSVLEHEAVPNTTTWPNRTGLYKLDSAGLYTGVSTALRANAPEGSEGSTWLFDAAQATDGSIFLTYYRRVLQEPAEEVMVKLTSALSVDATFGSAGEVVLRSFSLDESFGVSRFAPDVSIDANQGVGVIVTSGIGENNEHDTTVYYFYDAVGHLAGVHNFEALPEGQNESRLVAEDTGLLQADGGFIRGSYSESMSFVFSRYGALDSDGNGIADINELDTDGDGEFDSTDPDDDNDGVDDALDAFPLDKNEWSDFDFDGTGDNADRDDDNDGFADAYELSVGSNPLDSSSFIGQPLVTQVDTDLDALGGVAMAQLPAARINFEKPIVEWMTPVADGYLVSGFTEGSFQFLAKIDLQGAVVPTFGHEGILVRQKGSQFDGSQRADVAVLPSGDIYWYTEGWLQKLDASGVIDTSFHNTSWAQSSDLPFVIDFDSVGVFIPTNTSWVGRRWGTLDLRDDGSVRVLSCDHRSLNHCDAAWYSVTESGDIDTRVEAEGIVSLGINFESSETDPVSGRTYLLVQLHRNELPSGRSILSALYAEQHVDGAPVESGVWMSRNALFNLSEEGVLDASKAVHWFGENSPVGNETTSWIMDVAEAEDGSIQYLFNRTFGNGTNLNENVLRKLDANMHIDNSFAGTGELVIGSSTKEAHLTFSRFATDEPGYILAHSSSSDVPHDLISIDAVGNMVNVDTLQGLPAGYDYQLFPMKNVASTNSLGAFIYGGINELGEFVFAHIGLLDSDGDGVFDLNEVQSIGTIENDFDADGDSDLIWRHELSGETALWTMQDALVDQKLHLGVISDTEWKVISTGDFNADGHSDMLWRHAGQGWTSLWTFNNGTITSKKSLGTISDLNWQIIAEGDFDGDGDTDLLWQHSVSGAMTEWVVDNSEVVGRKYLGAVGPADWSIVSADDFDGDRQSDLLWRNLSTGEIVLWSMSAGVVSSKATVGIVPDMDWAIATTGDFNGDGNSDIIWHHNTGGWTSIWAMNGAAIANRSSLGTISKSDWTIEKLGDYDGDGDADLIWRGVNSGWVNLWQLQAGAVIAKNYVANVSSEWKLQ